jgi:hypothetical protein
LHSLSTLQSKAFDILLPASVYSDETMVGGGARSGCRPLYHPRSLPPADWASLVVEVTTLRVGLSTDLLIGVHHDLHQFISTDLDL